MSEPYQIAVLIPQGIPAENGIQKCHQILHEENINIEADSLLALHDTPTEEPEVEGIVDEAAAMQKLIDWPTLGSIDYAGTEGIVTVSYLGRPNESLLNCVLISTLERSTERAGAIPRYQRLAARLHKELGASRTIMDWGLEMRGFSHMEEIARLARGEIVGEYALLDLRTE